MTECKTTSSLTLDWFAVYLGKLQKYNNYDNASFSIFLCSHCRLKCHKIIKVTCIFDVRETLLLDAMRMRIPRTTFHAFLLYHG